MPKGPEQQIMKECSHCYGDGELPAHCYDCGDELYKSNLAKDDSKLNPEGDYLCKTCLENRRENADE